MLYCFKVNRSRMKGISLMERLNTTPFGLDVLNAYFYQEMKETRDSLHFLHI